MRLPTVAGCAVAVVSYGSMIGCSTADVMRFDHARRSPTAPASVQLLKEEPDRPYTTIAIVNVDDHGWDRSREALESKLVQVAAAEGGDAVISGGRARDAHGAVFVPLGGTWYGVPVFRKTLLGKVIAFDDN